MKTYIPVIALACALAAPLTLGVRAADDVTVTKTTTITTPMSSDIQLPAGITPKNLNENKDIEKAFKNVAEDALTYDHFDNLTNCLVDQDRTRLSSSLGKSKFTNVDGNNNKRLNDLANSLEKTWQGKYNTKVDIDVGRSYNPDFLHILTGEVSDPNQLVGKWPVDTGLTLPAGAKTSANDIRNTQNHVTGGDVNLEKGRNVAVVHIPASHGLPGLTVSMIHEAGGWKFDIPNTLTAQKLYDNLVANLGYIDQHRSDIPADVNEGNRFLTHAVVASFYDVDLGKSTTGGSANNR